RPLLGDYKKEKKINDLQLIMYGDMVKDSNSYLESRGSIEDFVSFREMITSQLLYLRGNIDLNNLSLNDLRSYFNLYRYKSDEGYHAVPPLYTGTFIPPKPDLVFYDTPPTSETVPHVVHVESSTNKTSNELSKTPRPDAPIIEDSTSNSENESRLESGNPRQGLKDKGVINSGCSRHMTRNISYLSNFEEINGGYVAFGGNPKCGKITGKGKIKTGKLDFDDVYFVKELKFNLFSLPDENHVLLKVPRENNMYNVDLKNVVPLGDLTYLFAKATLDESNLWHRSLGHINFNTMNKLVKDMPALEDIVYSDDEEDVGAEADFSNLEINISVSPIPITRVYKVHLVSQIIGKLTTAPQTRSMSRMGHTQEEGIDRKEVFALIERIEAIRLFLDYASFMCFMVYQMYVKSAFLYGTIEEKVYVCQPLGFEDPNYPNKVYKVVKAIYGLHQAPRAWYKTLTNYLLENGFQRVKIDQTLFIKTQKGDILLVQVYVDDIIFGSTNKEVRKSFEKLMKDKFQMSLMGELTFFLGLQVKQKDDGIFISQDKYIAEILRKFDLRDGKSASTPIDTEKPLLKDLDDEDVDVHIYSNYAGARLDRKSTIGGYQFLGCRLIFWQCKKQTVVATSSTKAEYVSAASCCAQVLWIQN
nr:putative ribonuclease H-like domain-containing protein [Tanacetum cinerariifolium]GEX97943.1 putative ribonuclease H-like domain-containing protein [Tanacetum cinerariifolium]